jgi:S1-C subfamily serine protease
MRIRVKARQASMSESSRARSSSSLRALRFVVAAMLPTTLLSGCASAAAPQASRAASEITLKQSDAPPPHSSVAAMVKRILPSVVNVRVTDVAVNPFGRQEEMKAQGSGVVVDRDGVILTNNHVIHGAVKVTVVFEDGRRMPGRVIGADPEHDLAVIKVDARNLRPIVLGHSRDLQLGDSVVAVGFPLGLGGPTVTKGIVSGLGRTVQVGTDGGQPEHLAGLLQTDAAINPGNSGGALADMSGQLVGINTAAAQAGSAENVGFAISIDEALPVVEQILTQRPSQRAWLGVQAATIDAALAAQLGLPVDTRGGVIVGVIPSSPAARAGLDQGDVIVAVNGERITSASDLTSALTRYSPGDRVALRVVGRGGSNSVELVLARRPATF